MTILAAWLLADFISGLVHWWEDRAMMDASRFAFLNGVRADNDRHHKQPGYLVRLSWWENINTTAPIAWSSALLLWGVGAPDLVVITAAFLGIGNLVHRWSHEAPRNLPVLVRWLQRTGLFISGSHHSGHHYVAGVPVSRNDSKIRFCVMSNWLNPVLDRTRFFHVLEALFRISHAPRNT